MIISGQKAPFFNRNFNLNFPPNPTTINLSNPSKHGVYLNTDTIGINCNGNFEVFNQYGEAVFSGISSGNLQLPMGHYFIQSDGDRNQFSVLSSDRPVKNLMGAEMWIGQRDSERARALGFTWARLHAFTWSNLTTSKTGNIDFSSADTVINSLFNSGLDISFTLAYPRPSWQTNNSEYNADYSGFCKQVMQRYGGKVKVWEVINEPYYTNCPTYNYPNEPWIDWTQRLSDLNLIVDTLRDQYSPTSKIVAGNFSTKYGYFCNDTGKCNAFAAFSGSHQVIDHYCWHQSVGIEDNSNRVFDQYNNYTLSVYEMYQKIHNWYNEPDKKMFMNEQHWQGLSAFGFNAQDYLGQSPIDWKRAGWETAKDVIMAKADGVEGLIIHVLLSNPPSADAVPYYGWGYGERGPEFKVTTALTANYLLKDKLFVTGTNTFTDSIKNKSLWQFVFEDVNKNQTVCAWTTWGHSGTLDIPNTVHKDIWGRTISNNLVTEEPTLFIYSGSGITTGTPPSTGIPTSSGLATGVSAPINLKGSKKKRR